MRNRTSDYHSSDTEQMLMSEDIYANVPLVDDYRDIFVMRPQMQTNNGGSFKEAKQLYDNGDDEVRQLLLKECRLIYECKKCRNMFRSLTQFIGHKRVFCRRTVCSDDGGSAGGDNYNGFTSCSKKAAKENCNGTNGKCESILEKDDDDATVQQAKTFCKSREVQDEKMADGCAVRPPVEHSPPERIQNILPCPQENCTLSFSNTKELEKHFSQDHTNAMVFTSQTEKFIPEQQKKPATEKLQEQQKQPIELLQQQEQSIELLQQQQKQTTEPTVVQTRAKRMLSNSYHKCEHCCKIFDRNEALITHLMHCPVKHNILSKTLAAGITSGTVVAKRIKLQTSTVASIEEPPSIKRSNDKKGKEGENPEYKICEKPVTVLKDAINIKQEYVPSQDSSLTSTHACIVAKKKKMKNRRKSFLNKISACLDDGSSAHIEDIVPIKQENTSSIEMGRNIPKVKSECNAHSDVSDLEPRKLLSTCTYCSKSFERRAALSTHLQHCIAKNCVFDKTTIYGMNSCTKRSKINATLENTCKEPRLQSITTTVAEDPDTELLNEMFANLGRQTFGIGLRTVTIEQEDLTASGTEETKEDDLEEEQQEDKTQNAVVKNSSVDESVSNEEPTATSTPELLTNLPDDNEENTDKKLNRRMRTAPIEKRLLCRCKICFKQFTALSNVRRHISMFHHRSQRFGCTLCDYRAFRRYDIVNHLGNSHGMTGDPEKMSIELVSEHEVNYRREDVDGDIVVLEGGDNDGNTANVVNVDNTAKILPEDLENSNENSHNAKRLKRNKTTSVSAGPTAVVTKATRQKLKSSQTQLVETYAGGGGGGGDGGKTPSRRPIRNRIKAENKDFVYDLSSLVKKENNGAQIEIASRTLRRRNTVNNGSLEANVHCIESLLGPADKRDHIRGAAQRLASAVISSGTATSATQPELPTERPQMRRRLIPTQRVENSAVPVYEASELEAARLQSALIEDTFLEKVAKDSPTTFKIKPSLSLHTSTLSWLLEKVDSSLHQNGSNGKSSPCQNTVDCDDKSIKSLQVSPPPSIPRANAPPPTPRKRITMLDRLRDDTFKYRNNALRSALEN